MNILLNVSSVDGACQFVTKECAEAAAQDLAGALRRDAEAVANPLVRSSVYWYLLKSSLRPTGTHVGVLVLAKRSPPPIDEILFIGL